MNRYTNSDVYREKKSNGTFGVEYYSTNYYPEIPLSENDVYAITTRGDRLDLLANQFYNDTTLYWIIATANPTIPQDSLSIPEGTQIRIPKNIQNILFEYDELNSL